MIGLSTEHFAYRKVGYWRVFQGLLRFQEGIRVLRANPRFFTELWTNSVEMRSRDNRNDGFIG
jgi:hypothetical protein